MGHQKKVFKNTMIVVFSLMLTALGGCDSPDENANDDFGLPFEVVSGDVARNTTPDVSSTDIDKGVTDNTQFAMDLYGRLVSDIDESDNLFYSPYSISVALSMAYGGAEGETKKQMQSTLHFNLEEPKLYESFNALDLALTSRGKNAEGIDGTPFQLHIVNDTWGQKDGGFLENYLNLLSEYYGADLKTLDFAANPETSRAVINEYISEQTQNCINDLLPKGTISDMTRMVLTNAIYFNAAWANQFEEENTSPQPFTSLKGTEKSVPTMHQTEYMGHMAGDGFDAVSLGYDGGEMSMVFILPAAGEFSEFESQLSADLLQNVFDGLESKRVRLSLPSFEFETGMLLKKQLKALGMEEPFGESADFSGMTGDREFLISDVIHKAFVKVNENGTEAAAATAIVMDVTSADPEEPITMTIDRSFFFVIRDNLTGTILFAGRMVDM